MFSNNDRPGIMLAGAALTYLNRYGVTPGRRAVLAGSHDSIYMAALDLADAGVEVAAVLDARADPQGAAVAAAREAGLPVRTGTCIVESRGPPARERGDARRADVRWLDPRCRPRSLRLRADERRLDAVGASVLAVARQAQVRCGCRSVPAGCFGAKRNVGWGVRRRSGAWRPSRASGSAAGRTAAQAWWICGGGGRAPIVSKTALEATDATARANAPRLPQGMAKAFVDFQNDVTSRDLELAAREGFRSIEHIKRYTTTGMATDQGKTSNINALAVVSGTLERAGARRWG